MRSFIFCCVLLLSLGSSGFAQTLTVKQLYDEHRKNSRNFENKYRGQKLTVTGKIRSISPVSYFWKGEENYHKIYLTATGYENYVVCQVPYKDSALLGSFKTGDVITVTGVVAPVILDAVYLNECSFAAASRVAPPRAAPPNAPLGKYNVYQNDGAGFSYQYTLYLNSYTAYTLNGRSGKCAYSASSKVLRFTSGPLKGFTGLYRPFSDNEQDPPTLVLNVNGAVPDLKAGSRGYQYGYYKGR